jgi:hypothetical protein
MNLDYLERNADYVATMEEATRRLQAAGQFLTIQSLYRFVGPDVAGSWAKVAEFLHERGDAPQADAFWDLRGRIGQWITDHAMEGDLHQVALYLARLTAEMGWVRDTHVLNELWKLTEPQSSGTDTEAWAADPDDQ